MTSTLNSDSASQTHALPVEIIAIDAEQFKTARQDLRVRRFLAEADAYLAELEQHSRNR